MGSACAIHPLTLRLDGDDETISRVIAHALASYADRPTFIEDGIATTLGAHFQQVGRIVAALARHGVGRGDRVAMLGRTSRVYIAMWHAALLGHFVLIPLNSRLAAAEIEAVLANGDPAILIHDGAFAELAAEVAAMRTGLATAAVEELLEAPLSAVDAIEPPGVRPDDIAAIMYTSGTSGIPKGVELRQSTIYRLYRDADYLWDLHAAGTCLYTTNPLFHVSALYNVVGPPLRGNRTVIASKFDVDQLLADSRTYKLTHFSVVPTMFRQILEHPGFRSEDHQHIRYMVYGGAPADAETVKLLLQRLPNLAMLHCYGSTEAVSPLTKLSGEDHRNRLDKLRSCGGALPDTELRIRDATGTLCEPGTVGEIEARAPGMFAAYWRNPDATRQAIEDGWFRSGDLGIIDEDGYLFIVDRLKDMIITGGENVYSQEVERAIAGLDGVAQVAVIGIPSEKWGEQVHAVVVPQAGAVLDDASLLAGLRTRLAGYKCPKSFEFTDQPLPLSGTNKVNKRLLRERLRKPSDG